jgi:hypothetical protein
MQLLELSRFLDSYFHQDWDLEFASPSEAATHFGSTCPIEDVFLALGEGQVLLARCNESEIRSHLSSSAYCFCETDVASEWLREILAAIAAAAALRP